MYIPYIHIYHVIYIKYLKATSTLSGMFVGACALTTAWVGLGLRTVRMNGDFIFIVAPHWWKMLPPP